MSSSFGTMFRVTTFGESHCRGVGAIVDGCPSRLDLCEADIQAQLDRRRPGQNRMTTDRSEKDRVTILSGVENGKTLGTPIGLFVANEDQRPSDYGNLQNVPRPSHADFTYQIKYGIRAASGGGRASARETIGRVAAGAIAEKYLKECFGIEIVAWVSSVETLDMPAVDMMPVTREMVDRSIIRCPHPETADRMIEAVQRAKADLDSVGGVISCVCRHVPPGLGEPVFEKLEAKLAQAMLSLPATKGFEVGSGFSGAKLRGSIHNDPFIWENGQMRTRSNNSGGIQGGISNGEPIFFRVAFKPPATIGKSQETVNFKGDPVLLSAKGRHDPCVVARAVPIVESMTALVLMDMTLRQEWRKRADEAI